MFGSDAWTVEWNVVDRCELLAIDDGILSWVVGGVGAVCVQGKQ